MTQGKKTCKILKEIRKRIAEANDIEYVISECQYKGDCLGTCPKCEAEVRYLEQALERKHLAGKVVSVLGISVGLMGLPQAVCGMDEGMSVEREKICSSLDSVLVKGRVTDSLGNPLAEAHILEKGTTHGTCSDRDGYFTLRVSGKLPLFVSFVGYKSKEVWVPRGGSSRLQVVLSDEFFPLDEINVKSYATTSMRSFTSGGITSLKGGDIVSAPRGWFRVGGCVTDENGLPLSGVVVYRKRKGKDFPEHITVDGGIFEFNLKRRRRLWFAKEGYQEQRVKVKKKNASGLQIVLKVEE